MNRKTVLAALTVVLTMCFFASCQEQLEENDLLQGKWREKAVVDKPDATECELKSYIEFSEYVYEAKNRQMLQVDACKGTTTYNNYTIAGDTLIIVDDKNITKKYLLKTVDQSTLVYTDKDNRTFTYKRYN